MHVLAAIAFRDRLGKNGQGCWASYAKLAEDTNYDLTAVSKAIADLVRWGYVSRERNPQKKHRRMRVLRVIYRPGEQSLVDTEETTDAWPIDHELGDNACSEHEKLDAGGEFGAEHPEEVAHDGSINGLYASDYPSIHGVETRLNKIWLSQSKKNSGEPAPPNGVARAENEDCRDDRQEMATYLRKVQDALRGTEHRPLTKGERQYFAHHMRRCAEIADEILYCARRDDVDPADQSLGFQAERLAGQMADRVEGAAA